MKNLKKICISVIFSLCILPLFSTIVTSKEWGFSLDLPEDFTLLESNKFDHYLFSLNNRSIFTAITVYQQGHFSSSSEALAMVTDKLRAQGEEVPFVWQNRKCSIANFSFVLNDEPFSSWAIASPLAIDGSFLVVIAYSVQKELSPQKESVLLSILDSLCINHDDWFNPGPVTAFSFPDEEQTAPALLSIDKTELSVMIAGNAADANQYVIDREFTVLSYYAQNSSWQNAWKRFYRTIYRDAYNRLEATGKHLQQFVESKTSDKREQIQILLSWVQEMPYSRNRLGSDITALPALLFKKPSDCDSRSLLLALVLRQMGFNTVLFVSRDYSHAVLGIEFDGFGARIMVEDTSFLVGETTAHVALGLIDSTMSDATKWIGVAFLKK